MNKERFYDVINAILSFLFCRWLFMTFLFYQFTTIFMTVDFWPTLAAILLMTGFCFTLFRLVYQPGISRLTLWFFYACYGLLLVYLLFFKSMGVKGVNWDLLTFSQDLFLNPTILVFNLLLFLPLGLLFSFSWKKLSLFVGAILLVEACQFFFSLGFFDLGDILLNTSGFALGNFLEKSAIAQSFKNRIQKK
ncbi:teicoplanin resistance protein VanZ [Streptococcus suis]|uniref:VanZ family protein n=1 Tax=Streptococcus suis TaxID=1307 RepID=A0A0Z8KSS6_STRSU|nr:VanZ family protein [Streptococcus suis]MCK3948200.1 teicoplanin resistance protein VanZ [Streptococcus suis]MCK3963589.1 teicoplanin resistance protein VanZ [Streptococcus suis]MCK3990258.1 teicoplanin resistance protein VanZ [Streptococcus suis]MDE1695994.1 VanZ family protein [Streptococcus suis]NQG46560.1 teicoplanin resistance protein VanZ [Streptococcus suis]